MGEKLLGVISLGVPKLFGGYWAFYFMDSRVIVAEIATGGETGESVLRSRIGHIAAGNLIGGDISGSTGGTRQANNAIREDIKKADELSKESPEKILSGSKDNFAIPYNKITKVKITKGDFQNSTVMIISTDEKEYEYKLLNHFGGVDHEGFDHYLTLLESIFHDRLKYVEPKVV